MDIITDLKQQFKTAEYITVEHFHINNDDKARWFDEDMPIPLTINLGWNKGYSISYALDGYFGTPKGIEYLQDTRLKIGEILGDWRTLDFLPDIQKLQTQGHYHPKLYKLKDFSHLEYEKPKKIWTPKKEVYGKDKLFEIARWDIYASKENGVLSEKNTFEILSMYNTRLQLKRSLGDLRAKAKNITEWTEQYYSKGEWTAELQAESSLKSYHKRKGEVMTRQEAVKVATNARTIQAKAKAETVIQMLKKQGEKISQNKVSELSGVNRRTLAKYWNDLTS